MSEDQIYAAESSGDSEQPVYTSDVRQVYNIHIQPCGLAM